MLFMDVISIQHHIQILYIYILSKYIYILFFDQLFHIFNFFIRTLLLTQNLFNYDN